MRRFFREATAFWAPCSSSLRVISGLFDHPVNMARLHWFYIGQQNCANMRPLPSLYGNPLKGSAKSPASWGLALADRRLGGIGFYLSPYRPCRGVRNLGRTRATAGRGMTALEATRSPIAPPSPSHLARAKAI